MEPDRPDVAEQRSQWQLAQAGLDPAHLVFIDETWAATNITRSRGRSLRGERLFDQVPHGHWKTTTFLAALRGTRLTAPLVIDGTLTGDLLRKWVE